MSRKDLEELRARVEKLEKKTQTMMETGKTTHDIIGERVDDQKMEHDWLYRRVMRMVDENRGLGARLYKVEQSLAKLHDIDGDPIFEPQAPAPEEEREPGNGEPYCPDCGERGINCHCQPTDPDDHPPHPDTSTQPEDMDVLGEVG